MAIYFLNVKSVGRSSGSSAVSAAAYRSGERIRDERTGRTYDHSGRQDVLHKEIMLPNQFSANEMAWAKDRGNLWNSAESAEVRRDARTAREYLVALPAELSPQARINLVTGFSRELVERYRFALDIAIHAPRDFPGSDPRNFHAHLLATTREATLTGLGAKTTLELSDTHRRQIGLGPAVGELLHVRERWAVAANAALEQAQVNTRIDHRTLQAQGIDREPKPHIPRAAFEMERHGYHSEVAERIRARHQLRVEARLQRAAQHEKSVAAPKSLGDRAKEFAQRWLRYGQPQKVGRSKRPEVMAKESAQRRVPYRQPQKAGRSRRPEETAKESAQRQAHYRQPRQEAQPKGPRDLAKEAAMRWKALYDQSQEAQSKNPRDLAKEAAMRWKALYDQPQEAQSKGPQDLAKEAAMRWKARYGQEARAKGQTQERKQDELAPASAKRGRDLDLSR